MHNIVPTVIKSSNINYFVFLKNLEIDFYKS